MVNPAHHEKPDWFKYAFLDMRDDIEEKVGVAQVDMRFDRPLVAPDGRKRSSAEWVRELNIRYAPSLVFFDVQGNEVFRTEAYLRRFHVHDAMDYVDSGAYRVQPSFQRFLQHRSEVLAARGIPVDLMQ